ncbi:MULTISPECIES: DNA-deoxyinosine glycosylase [Caproicibacterium]|uniref:DNA-deoxyinosine glycosylase n=1 Tax=Caproicibacterium lactatifermentans TaxID=2666138 RepID=A0A859DQI8_9FIRM|nr:DNA-deoxyinosine glycosylase [Caproicibacterium lactatifermentans]ARP50312.1 DNA-deoxyinosine glycosylase [Ruminococcaceae bacterium CPB6]QKN23966.1 DNA-deoxyinosine glycosylase [Caproicibacterium lactatifermentans]QKO30962.1 DNA-deoxyinosine glycosylase [Caproicibacterium lactatifermentans]
MNTQTVEHPLRPVFAADSRVLILGTMPSPKSRETGFYYGHPQNRFWRVLATVFHQPVPSTINEKKTLLLQNHIALWDVLRACSISGADDSSIKDPQPNDIPKLLSRTNVYAVFTTGKKAYSLYQKLVFPTTHLQAVSLPSTSPANCRVSFTELVQEYRYIAKKVEEGEEKEKNGNCC